MDAILFSGQTLLAALATLAVAYFVAFGVAWVGSGWIREPWRWPSLGVGAVGLIAAGIATLVAYPVAGFVFALLAPEEVLCSIEAVMQNRWPLPRPYGPPAVAVLTLGALVVAGLAALWILLQRRSVIWIGLAILLGVFLLAPLADRIAAPALAWAPPGSRSLAWLPPVFLLAVAGAALAGGLDPYLRYRDWTRNALILVAGDSRQADPPGFEAPARDVGREDPARCPAGGEGRRIVIFCDGTSNRPDQLTDGRPAPTNVWRLYDALRKNERQTGWYDAGVGSDTSSQATKARLARVALKTIGVKPLARVAAWAGKLRQALEAATGVGISENIVQAYCEIVRQYRPGDRIYLFGFSRGAYTARCVAGVIRRCGVLRPENIRYVPDVVRLYRTRFDPGADVPIRAELRHEALPAIEFMGLFDTVASLGVPLWGWWFNARAYFRNVSLDTNPAAICRHIYHAMAMDERRSQFFPTPFTPPEPDRMGWLVTLEQVWFRGVHGDVGGGYAETGLSDIALGWMLEKAGGHGLEFDRKLKRSLRPDGLARLHDQLERQPSWRFFGSWPRWHPVPGGPADAARFGTLHDSVLIRRAAIETIGRHDQTVVSETPIPFDPQPQREWDRTGLVLEGGGVRYEITWRDLPQRWRDLDCAPCGPSGQTDRKDGFPAIRPMFRDLRRVREAEWMTLCLTVAHPRDWPLREGGLSELYRYLTGATPPALACQVAAVGQKLLSPGKLVLIENRAGAGMLYVFANDCWATAANNSGTVPLSIRRVREDARKPDFVLEPLSLEEAAGRWRAPGEATAWQNGSKWVPGAP